MSLADSLTTMYGNSIDGQWSIRLDGAHTRLLGPYEQFCYWNSLRNGIGYITEHLTVDIQSDIQAQHVFNEPNVTRAWTHLKCMYPLLGAQVEERDGHVNFVVRIENLRSMHADELMFSQVAADKEASDMVQDLTKTPSPRHPSRVYVLFCSNNSQRVHVILQVAHWATDGTAQTTVKNTFLDLVAQDRPFEFRLEERLARSLAVETLRPGHPNTSPRQRWRLAIAAVINQQRPLRGGHTLPRTVTTTTPFKHTVSRSMGIGLSLDLSASIINKCRKIGISFGKVFPVLGQIGATRVLFRHYMCGKISEAEWEYRKRQPMHTTGPINVRSMLDKQWYKDGGESHVCVSIAPYALTLPFMPLGDLAKVKPCPDMSVEIPPFSSFLSRDRFLLRARVVQKQLNRFLKHPLFFERLETSILRENPQVIRTTLQYREEATKPKELKTKEEVIPLLDSSESDLIWTHSGSSYGLTDARCPMAFPLNTKVGGVPLLRVKGQLTYLCCPPAFLYLGSVCYKRKVYTFVYWDRNVYEEDTVKEFLEEVKGAAEWYLADEGRPEPRSQAKL